MRVEGSSQGEGKEGAVQAGNATPVGLSSTTRSWFLNQDVEFQVITLLVGAPILASGVRFNELANRESHG